MELICERTCPGCKKDFEYINPKQKFCSELCRARFNSKNNYHRKYKFDEEKVKKAKKRSSEWIKNNYPHFKDLVRPKSKVYQAKRVLDRRKKGICVLCGVPTVIKANGKPMWFCRSCSDKRNLKRNLKGL